MKIGIRVDGSKKLGMGNIYRSLTLASELSQARHNVCFIMKGFTEAIRFIEDKGFPIFLLSHELCNGALNAQVEHIINSNSLKMIINDVKDTDPEYMAHLKKTGVILINFDDLGPGRNHADLLFDAFYFQNSIVSARFCFGPQFLILRKEFLEYMNQKKINPEVKEISLLMGAANTGGFLQKILEALIKLPSSIKCNIILSNTIQNAEIFQLEYSRDNFTFYYQPANIADIFARCDIAITAGGISMCETCSLGIPTLVIPQVQHEFFNALWFEKQGAVCTFPYNPELESEEIIASILNLIDDYSKRLTLSENAKKLIDGKGLKRTVHKINKLVATPRFAPPCYEASGFN